MPEQTEVKPAAPVETAPPVPQKPSAVASEKSEKEAAELVNKSRRRILWACIWGYLGVNFLMFLRFFFPRAIYEPNPIVNIGYSSDFAMGVNQEFLMSNRIWVVKEPGQLFVIFARCTHLGCTPDWLAAQNIFHCPCHGSEYDSEGVNFAGPAPRPMDRCHVEPDPAGRIIVDTSRLYMRDPRSGLDQFNDPSAWLPV